MRRRGHHVSGTGFGPGYDPNRNTQWNANKEAVLHFLSGGYVEVLVNSVWRQIMHPDRLQFFHFYQARPCGWTKRPDIIKLVDSRIT